jgi:hypothetical protein
MSNKHFFQLYNNNLYGLTGTLGNTTSKTFLLETYKINYITIPATYQKQFYLENPRIALTTQEHAHQIIDAVK